MNQNAVIEKTVAFVKSHLADAEAGHDWSHIQRVWSVARNIAKQEQVDHLVVDLGVLLHDIADAKFHHGDDSVGPMIAADFLSTTAVSPAVKEHVVQIVRHVSFKGGNTEDYFLSNELKVVRDADRLDAMGAIGIARAFNYGGFRGRALYDPDIPPQLDMNPETYRKSKSPTLNHFYEKLLLLKDRMYTDTGRKMAEERHQFMLSYLQQFYLEWEGKA